MRVDRVPRGERPTFELHLEPHQRVVAVEHYGEIDYASRKTVDHFATLWIEHRFGGTIADLVTSLITAVERAEELISAGDFGTWTRSSRQHAR